MKTNFIHSLTRYLVEREYYNLISPEALQSSSGNSTVGMIREFQGTTVLVELIDGDRLTGAQVGQTMGNGAAMLNNINGTNATILKVFLFDDGADSEKADLIAQGQVDDISQKKFLKAISVNIKDRKAIKHFSVPAFDGKLIKAVKRFFSKDLDKREISADDILRLVEQRQKDFEIQFKAKKPWITYGLIIANLLVYAVIKLISLKTSASYDSLLEPFGAKVNRLILEGEYWRLITPMFLHGDEIHLAVNCYSLYIVGSQVEKLYGHRNFTAIYFVAGLLGCIASFAFSVNASVGASGAIFGLLGAMLYFAVKRPSLLKSNYGANLITTLVINLAYGFVNPRIDNYGHLGGLVGGFLTTGVVYSAKETTSRDRLRKIAALIAVVAITVGGLFYGFNNNQNYIVKRLELLETYDSQQNWTASEKLAEELLDRKPSNKYLEINILWHLTWAEIRQEKYDESIAHAGCLAEISPADGRFVLGINYFSIGEYQKAKQELSQAKALGSPNAQTIDSLLESIDKALAP